MNRIPLKKFNTYSQLTGMKLSFFMFHEMPAALPTSMRLVLTIMQREEEQRDINYIKIVAYSELSIDCCLKIENRKQGGCSFLWKEIYVETGALVLRGFLHQSIFGKTMFFEMTC